MRSRDGPHRHLLTTGRHAAEIEERRLSTRPAPTCCSACSKRTRGQREGGRIALTARFVEPSNIAASWRPSWNSRVSSSPISRTSSRADSDPGRFLRASRTFGLFSYGRAFEYSPENYGRTLRWVRFTTALTRYEAASCIARYDFGRHRRMLDIGGNSGEFGLQVCKRHAGLKVSVFDLPLVCDIGREHLAPEPEAGG